MFVRLVVLPTKDEEVAGFKVEHLDRLVGNALEVKFTRSAKGKDGDAGARFPRPRFVGMVPNLVTPVLVLGANDVVEPWFPVRERQVGVERFDELVHARVVGVTFVLEKAFVLEARVVVDMDVPFAARHKEFTPGNGFTAIPHVLFFSRNPRHGRHVVEHTVGTLTVLL
jgi:hypothetical protein